MVLFAAKIVLVNAICHLVNAIRYLVNAIVHFLLLLHRTSDKTEKYLPFCIFVISQKLLKTLNSCFTQIQKITWPLIELQRRFDNHWIAPRIRRVSLFIPPF